MSGWQSLQATALGMAVAPAHRDSDGTLTPSPVRPGPWSTASHLTSFAERTCLAQPDASHCEQGSSCTYPDF
jgi:hypothetical protein